MRETKFAFDSMATLAASWKSATQDRHKVVKVLIPRNSHNAVVKTYLWGRDNLAAVPKEFCDVYDGSTRALMQDDDECGTLFGVPVFIDDSLARGFLTLESEPLPADKL
jgi:hypothetical protein